MILVLRRQWRVWQFGMFTLCLVGLSGTGLMPSSYTNCHGCQSILDWWPTMRDQSIPGTLRTIGFLVAPPESVVMEAVRSLDAHDMPRLLKLVGPHHASQFASFQETMQVWPPHMLEDPRTWVVVGPYPAESWYRPPPIGTLRRLPVRVTHPHGGAECVIWVRNTVDGWQVIAIAPGQ